MQFVSRRDLDQPVDPPLSTAWLSRRGNDENPLITRPCGIGDQPCFAGLRATNKHAGSATTPANRPAIGNRTMESDL